MTKRVRVSFGSNTNVLKLIVVMDVYSVNMLKSLNCTL